MGPLVRHDGHVGWICVGRGHGAQTDGVQKARYLVAHQLALRDQGLGGLVDRIFVDVHQTPVVDVGRAEQLRNDAPATWVAEHGARPGSLREHARGNLGHGYELPDGTSLPGLGLVDLRTVREPGERLIGNVVIEADLGDGPRRIAGFENHGGRTYLGESEAPLGTVVSGFGNNGKDRREGVRRNKLIGTYLHGPLLPKNAWLADTLIEWALEPRIGERPSLEPLDDRLEELAHASAVRAALG